LNPGKRRWVELHVARASSHAASGGSWGRDYWDVAPITGIVTGGGDHLIEVGVDVIPMA
jgi:hypothetical protein